MSQKWKGQNGLPLQDSRILDRVQKCLGESKQKNVEFGQLIRQLQAKYPEYRRRKQGHFRLLVKQTLRIIHPDTKQLSNEETTLPIVNEVNGDCCEIMDVPLRPKKSVVSNLLNNMYNKPNTPKPASKRKVDETISISDESQESQNIKQINLGSPRLSSELCSGDLSLESPSIVSDQQRAENATIEVRPGKRLMNGSVEDFISDSNEQNDERNENEEAFTDRGIKNKTKESPVRSFKKTIKLENSILSFKHLGGVEKLLKDLCQILIHIKSPEMYANLGVNPPQGILIYGTTGCGKTCLAYAIAGQLKIPIINVPTTELIAGATGESEERIRDIFDQAAILSPCVLFLDDIDAISTDRLNAQKAMEHRIVSQLISSMDILRMSSNGRNVLVIGSTTRPDIVDPALRRFGRFDHEIALPIPDRKGRTEILHLICNGLKLEPDFNFDMIAELTPGYVGADLSALVSRAALFAVKRKFVNYFRLNKHAFKYVVEQIRPKLKVGRRSWLFVQQLPTDGDRSLQTNSHLKDCNNIDMSNNSRPVSADTITIDVDREDSDEMCTRNCEPAAISRERDTKKPTLAQMIDWLNFPVEKIEVDDCFITVKDFNAAIEILQPSAKREGFLTVPDVSWEDIGSLHDMREELRLAILAPVKYSDNMMRLGLTAPSGVLLCGPPGCGKTLIAKAIANEAGINFISVKGPELMKMYVGESERSVRDCFQRARNAAPCVIFFDEFDSLCPKRSDAHEGSSGIRVVNQLLTEMDGVEDRKGVYVMAATNRPDIIDPAIMRPGRLDTILYVGLPNENDRCDILRAATKNRTKPVLAEDVIFTELAKKTEGFTGADLSGLVRKASMIALKDAIENQYDLKALNVAMQHFEKALTKVRPSISQQDQKIYERMRLRYAAPRFATETNSTDGSV